MHTVIVCERTDNGVFHHFLELNEEEYDINDKNELIQYAMDNISFLERDRMLSVIVMRNSVEGGPKLVDCWE